MTGRHRHPAWCAPEQCTYLTRLDGLPLQHRSARYVVDSCGVRADLWLKEEIGCEPMIALTLTWRSTGFSGDLPLPMAGPFGEQIWRLAYEASTSTATGGTRI